MMEIVYDRNSFKPYYCLFLSVILVSVSTENYTGETGTEIYIRCATGISNFLFSFCSCSYSSFCFCSVSVTTERERLAETYYSESLPVLCMQSWDRS